MELKYFKKVFYIYIVLYFLYINLSRKEKEKLCFKD